MTVQTETIPPWKVEEVEALKDLLEEADSVGIVSLTGIPSRQLQTMRRELHETARLRVSRNTLVRLALEEVDEGLEELVEHVNGQVGIVLSDANPFALFRQLEASKTPAPISAGEIAPNDIIIEGGDTGIDPGPFVGELQNAGVPARIDQGSIEVIETTTVLEAGDTVTPEQEGIFNELELEPKEVGLDLRAVLADGVIFFSEDLALDIDAYRSDIASASSNARGLATEVAYPAVEVVPALLSKADTAAMSVAVKAGFIEAKTADAVLSAAVADGRTLAVTIDDDEVVPAADIPAGPAQDAVSTTEEADTTDEEPTEEADADDEPEDDDEEEASAEGLGDLFG